MVKQQNIHSDPTNRSLLYIYIYIAYAYVAKYTWKMSANNIHFF